MADGGGAGRGGAAGTPELRRVREGAPGTRQQRCKLPDWNHTWYWGPTTVSFAPPPPPDPCWPGRSSDLRPRPHRARSPPAGASLLSPEPRLVLPSARRTSPGSRLSAPPSPAPGLVAPRCPRASAPRPGPALTPMAALQSQAGSQAAAEPIHGPCSARRRLPGPRRPRPPVPDLLAPAAFTFTRGGRPRGPARGGAAHLPGSAQSPAHLGGPARPQPPREPAG